MALNVDLGKKNIVGKNVSLGVITPKKKNPVFILCEVQEIKHLPDLLLVGDGTHALLLIAVLGKDVSSAVPLPRTLKEELRQCKRNVITKSHHHGSQGECFSFGDRGAYEKLSTSGSSLGQYAKKDEGNEKYLGSILQKYIKSARKDLNDIIPDFSYVATLALSAINDNLKINNIIKGIPCLFDETDYISGHFNVNARTLIFHYEFDITYTLISVPPQDNEIADHLKFHFRLNKEETLSINMIPGCTISYAAILLTHRQDCPVGETIYNVSAYGNQKLFLNCRSTYLRL